MNLFFCEISPYCFWNIYDKILWILNQKKPCRPHIFHAYNLLMTEVYALKKSVLLFKRLRYYLIFQGLTGYKYRLIKWISLRSFFFSVLYLIQTSRYNSLGFLGQDLEDFTNLGSKVDINLSCSLRLVTTPRYKSPNANCAVYC